MICMSNPDVDNYIVFMGDKIEDYGKSLSSQDPLIGTELNALFKAFYTNAVTYLAQKGKIAYTPANIQDCIVELIKSSMIIAYGNSIDESISNLKQYAYGTDWENDFMVVDNLDCQTKLILVTTLLTIISEHDMNTSKEIKAKGFLPYNPSVLGLYNPKERRNGNMIPKISDGDPMKKEW